MKNESKTKNSVRNILYGIFLKLVNIIVPFIIRTILIYYLGMEYAGLNSLFVSILQVLNIAEMGVSYAMLVNMYKPIATDDLDTLCCLLNIYKKYYRLIGFVIFCIGLLISPFIPQLVAGEVPKGVNLIIIYLMNLMGTVLSYWLFAYRASILQAYQRSDIENKVRLIVNLSQYILQIFVLIYIRSYYIYLIISLLFQIICNVTIAVVSKIKYPQIKARGKLSKEETTKINKQISDLFYGKFGMVITLSVDSIVISAFLGLISLGIYQNYYYIVTSIIGFFTIFYQSIRAAIGQNLVTKTIDENYKDFRIILYIGSCLLTFATSNLVSLYQPFITLWVGKENLLDITCVFLFGLYLLVYEFANIIMLYRDVAGLWHTDRFRSLITAFVNLFLNIVLVRIIGIYGILLSTIIAYVLIYIPWGYDRVFKELFRREMKKETTVVIAKYVILAVFSSAVSFILSNNVTLTNIYWELLLKLFIATTVSICIMLIFNLEMSKIVLMKVKTQVSRK